MDLLRLWPDAEAVQSCIKGEAEAIDDAVFLAVHQPMRFLRRDVGGDGQSAVRGEEELLEEFFDSGLARGATDLAHCGEFGIGEVSLIRWLDAQTKLRGDAERYHVIRVPKGSSLKGVLRVLLDGLEGSEFDRIREELATAREHLDPERAARQLQLSVRLRLERGACCDRAGHCGQRSAWGQGVADIWFTQDAACVARGPAS